jgi:fumarylacetoacetase
VNRTSWTGVTPDHPFGVHNLPYGVFSTSGDPAPRVGVRIGDQVLDVRAATAALLPARAELFAGATLNAFMAAGRPVWDEVRAAVQEWLTDDSTQSTLAPLLTPALDVQLHLPFEVADYVDFYSSEHHATHLGQLFRPGQPPLTPNWKHLPIGYHGRAGTVVVSGTPIRRPSGQRKTPDGEIAFGPSARLDIEAELGFVVGVPSELGTPVPLEDFADHVFGACLVNDWSARDIQAWEYVPLGPFLGKSFATSISHWIVPLAALDAARVAPPPRDPRPSAYLDDSETEPWGFDIALEVVLDGDVVSRPPFAGMYWTAAQQLAHLTVNGASVRTGDLFASGTISGPERDECGSLIELTWGGAEPLRLAGGRTRTFLEDGDEVVITASAPGPGGVRIGFGEVRGRIEPSFGPEANGTQ